MSDKNTNPKMKAEEDYPGAAYDKACKDETTAREVKSDVRQLNNNPRNTDIDDD